MTSSQRESWDAVVIGSGLGGLSAAAYLCASGKRTLVLESHIVAGGNSAVFRRDLHGRRYEFDIGVHYIGECGRDGLITKVLNGVGLAERVVFLPLDPDGYSTLMFPDFTFRIPVGWDRYRKRLIEQFPHDAEALGPVVDTLRAVSDEGDRLQRSEGEMGDAVAEAPNVMKWGLRPVTDLFEHYGISQEARAVILAEGGCFAVRPSQTPAVLQAGLLNHFLRGVYYPEGGGQAIAGRLIEAIRAYGGEVRTRTPVGHVRIENGRVAGVTLEKTDEEIDAPVVVSNADLKRTVLQMVGEEHFAPETAEKVRGYRMSYPIFCVYLGLDFDLTERGLTNSNYLMFDGYDLDKSYEHLEQGELPEEISGGIISGTLKDPNSPHMAPKGCSNLQVMALVPKSYAVWNVSKGPADGGYYHRDPKYREAKNAMTERLITSAERLIPDIRDHIEWKEAATPVTQERFTRSTGGTSYGIEMSMDQFGPNRMGPDTEIPGLYICGASASSGPGIAGVLRGGVAAAGAVVGRDLLKAAMAGDVIGPRNLLPEIRPDWDAWKESH